MSDSSSVHHQQFIYCTLSNGICHTAFEQDQDGTAVPSWSCSKAVYKPLWRIPFLSVQWMNSWWWTEELSEIYTVSCQNKFVELVHLFGCIIKKFVTMHGHTNVKNSNRLWNLMVPYRFHSMSPLEHIRFLMFYFSTSITITSPLGLPNTVPFTLPNKNCKEPKHLLCLNISSVSCSQTEDGYKYILLILLSNIQDPSFIWRLTVFTVRRWSPAREDSRKSR